MDGADAEKLLSFMKENLKRPSFHFDRRAKKSLISGCCCVLFHLVLEVFGSQSLRAVRWCNVFGHNQL